jgi:RNA polymerase sporulation-specific sigma factor
MFGFLSYLARYLFLFILHIAHGESFPKPLSKAEEQQYLEAAAKGDRSARDKLIEHNLRLVAHIIKKYYQNSGGQDDLVSIGTIGLIKAIDTFDLSKNIKLSSYASRCIENEILMHFRNLRKSAQDISLDDTIDTDKDGNPLTLMDIMAADDTILEDIDRRMNLAVLGKYIQSELTEREKTIILCRYGLGGREPMTQRELAKELNISRSYISRIEKKALQKLRARYENGE